MHVSSWALAMYAWHRTSYVYTYWLQLSLLAIDILILPASSAPVECIFSMAGESTSGKRNRLSDSNLNDAGADSVAAAEDVVL